jgi:hypothetical protein
MSGPSQIHRSMIQRAKETGGRVGSNGRGSVAQGECALAAASEVPAGAE